MSISEFLTRVDAIADNCTEDQLWQFVHEMAKITPEESQETFLNLFQAVAEGRINEEAEDYDNSLYNQYLTEDEYYLLNDLEEACSMVHQLVQARDYEKALALGKRLTGLDRIAFCLTERTERRHDVDVRMLLLDTMTAAYYASKRRCWDIYTCTKNQKGVTLKELLQYTEEKLPDFRTFLDEWILFLGETADQAYVRHALYQEALAMLPEGKDRSPFVQRYAEEFPEGYTLLLEDSSIPAETRWNLGREVLEVIRENGELRAEIALKTAEAAVCAGKSQEELERCWLEAFSSEPRAEHYLRAYVHSRDPMACKEKLDTAVAAWQKKAAVDIRWRMQWESASSVFQFLQGDALNLFRDVIWPKKSWGWNGFGGAFLCLAALYQKVPETRLMWDVYGKAKKELRFQKEKYLRGVPQSAILDLENAQPQLKLQGREDLDEDQLFLLCFRQWEARAVSFSDAEVEEILGGLQRIMEEQMSGSGTPELAYQYGDYALLAAALGEIRESMGQAGAKQEILARFAYINRRRPKCLAELSKRGLEAW